MISARPIAVTYAHAWAQHASRSRFVLREREVRLSSQESGKQGGTTDPGHGCFVPHPPSPHADPSSSWRSQERNPCQEGLGVMPAPSLQGFWASAAGRGGGVRGECAWGLAPPCVLSCASLPVAFLPTPSFHIGDRVLGGISST